MTIQAILISDFLSDIEYLAKQYGRMKIQTTVFETEQNKVVPISSLKKKKKSHLTLCSIYSPKIKKLKKSY